MPSTPDFTLRPVGRVISSLRDRSAAPKQAREGAPSAVLEFHPEFQEGLTDIRSGQEILLVTWLHQGIRETLRVHPRDDVSAPEQGVFNTRSQDRPNPIGIHRVRILAIETPLRLRVDALEAFDDTPILDVKPVLDERWEG